MLAPHAAPAVSSTVLDEKTWRPFLKDYYQQRGNATYWAFNFEKAWKKFERGVRQESELADRVERWKSLKGARVLVIGSYLGMEAIAYALRGAKVTGIDLDEEALDISRRLAREYGVEIDARSEDAANTSFADGTFDYVSCAQVLEHVPPEQQRGLLHEIWRICKPDGMFWLDTPNQWNYTDHHDTGLPFIHWLPRRIKVPLARLLGRAVPDPEPAFGNRPVYLHYYMSYLGVKRTLARLGKFEILTRYRGFADINHYAETRRKQGRSGISLRCKTAILKTLSPFWNWNWFSGIRLMVRKVPAA